jgi:hypothetical protein
MTASYDAFMDRGWLSEDRKWYPIDRKLRELNGIQ